MSETKYEFSRQPRFLPDMPFGKVSVPNPPTQYAKPEISWFMLLMPPLVMMVVTVLVAMTAKSAYMMISIVMTVTTLIGSLYATAHQISKYKQHKKIRESKYLQALADMRADLALSKNQQIEGLKEANPEPEVCLQRIIKTESRLWERTAVYEDFLSLRVGMGNAPFAVAVEYTPKEITIESDPLADEPERLALEFQRVEDVPICIDLQKSQVTGLAGEPDKLVDLLRIMLLQMITHHGYDDLKVVMLMKEENLNTWKWLKPLPHLWSSDEKTRYMICGSMMARQTLEEIYNDIRSRDLKQSSNNGAKNSFPHYVFIVEDAKLLENEAISKYLYNEHTQLGVSSVFIAPTRAHLPANCNAVVTVKGKNGEYYNRKTNLKSTFVIDQMDAVILEKSVRYLAPVRIKSVLSNFQLPQKIELLEMLGTNKVENVDVIGKWSINRTYKGMNVPIGALAGGELFNLDLHETGHGPHGLVAGTTGSGKSELLQSMIISLALHYHPHDLAFVLIDYKGGGMADVFKGMPHLVGTITNLGGNQTARALVSIKSELKRRQRLFSEAGVNNIDKYQKLYHQSGHSAKLEPIPHLIMIADEFAELKQEQPEFMKELVSAARVGRSLGVHLILATQKPAGVVDDQIWSNSKFKICLKVQDEADSRDVIKRPDAAMIKEPGRAYIQVGNDELFEIFQSTWSGADYVPEASKKTCKEEVKRLYRVGLNGKQTQIFPIDEEKFQENERETQLHAMVQYIQSVAEAQGITPLKGPWLPPMEDSVYLDQVNEDRGTAFDFETAKWPEASCELNPRVGMVDNPSEQYQQPLSVDFLNGGNLFIYGSSGSGKTTLLQTLCMSLAYQYSPREANLYLMDFGGTSFKKYESLPHCGGLMFLEQEQKINQFVAFLFQIIDERKRAFEVKKVSTFKEYRLDTGTELPAIFVMIDNYFALSETYEDLTEKMLLIAREGPRFGIYMIATASNATMVRYKFAVNFNNTIALQLTDKGEYYSIIGKTDGMEPDPIPGRGLIKGKPPLAVQIALPAFANKRIETLIQQFENAALTHSMKARSIPEMPVKVHVETVTHRGKGSMAVVGLNDQNLDPVLVDLKNSPFMMIAGEPQTGKSTLLMALLQQLMVNLGERVKIYAMDSPNLSLHPVLKWQQTTDLSSLNDVEEIRYELEKRRNELNEARRNNEDLQGVTDSWDQLVFAFDDFNDFTENGDYGLKELLEGILKRERDLKIAVLAAGEINRYESNWDPLGKSMRDLQTGVLLGSLKAQGVFNARMPYGTYEKDCQIGDGYMISKGKYTGLRAVYSDLGR